MDKTDEFSFILKPSSIAGVGVFALHDIDTNIKLALWPDDYKSRLIPEDEVPQALHQYCVARENNMWACPANFNRMEISWYLNHSTKPNAIKRKNGQFYSKRAIKEGEEILIDYNDLGEPEDKKEDYYRKKS